MIALLVVTGVATGLSGVPSSPALASGTWEPFGLVGYDVLNIEQQGGYLYAAVYPSPLGPELFGHGIWRRHEHPDSSWVQIGLEGLGIYGIWVNPADPLVIYATVLDTFWYPQSNGHLLYRTTDGGATWAPVEPGPGARGSRNVLDVPGDPMRMLVAAYPENYVNCVVWTSNDGGSTWRSSEQVAGILERSPVDPHTIWTTFNSGFFEGLIFRSDDDGQTWDMKFYDASRGVGPISISPTGRVFVARAGPYGGVMHSDDGGETWSIAVIAYDSSFWGVDVSPGSPNLVMAAEYYTRGSVWLSDDSGLSWVDVSAGVPDSLTYPEVMASDTQPGVFYVCAEGYDLSNTGAAIWRYQADAVVSTPPGASSAPRVDLSLDVEKSPVAKSATFVINRPVADLHSPLRIIDAQGRVVATLSDWHPAAAGASVTWDGKTSAGLTATPGVYFGVVTTPEGEVTARVVWLE